MGTFESLNCLTEKKIGAWLRAEMFPKVRKVLRSVFIQGVKPFERMYSQAGIFDTN